MVQHGPKVLVVCGPSGCGKSTLLRRLFDDHPDKFGFSVSHTSRSPRPGEVDGKHYHFTTRKDMETAIAKGEFLESVTFASNLYGTSLAAVETVWKSGKTCVLDIDVQGVKQVKQHPKILDPLLVFITVPSLKVLEDRLRKRGTETEESLRRRLAAAEQDIIYGETPGNFHLVILNDDLEKSYTKFRDFILRELAKC